MISKILASIFKFDGKIFYFDNFNLFKKPKTKIDNDRPLFEDLKFFKAIPIFIGTQNKWIMETLKGLIAVMFIDLLFYEGGHVQLTRKPLID